MHFYVSFLFNNGLGQQNWCSIFFFFFFYKLGNILTLKHSYQGKYLNSKNHIRWQLTKLYNGKWVKYHNHLWYGITWNDKSTSTPNYYFWVTNILQESDSVSMKTMHLFFINLHPDMITLFHRDIPNWIQVISP